MKPAHPLRTLTPAEERALQRASKATSQRVAVVKRAQALLLVNAGLAYTQAAQATGSQRGDRISPFVARFTQHGLAALSIAASRGRQPTYTREQRARIVAEGQREADRQAEQTATWSLLRLAAGAAQASAGPHRQRNQPPGGAGSALCFWQNAHLVSPRYRPTQAPSRDGARARPQGARQKPVIELAYAQAEAAGIGLWGQDEAGPSQAMPQAGEDWHRPGHPKAQPHEYVRGGTAKRLTRFRPASGLVQATGVLSAPNAVLHPGGQEPLPVRVPFPEDHPLLVTWQH
jgi:hypothetical protein